MSAIEEFIGKKDKAPLNRSFAVIVKNCVDCDYNCSYCYTEEVHEGRTMDLKTAEIMIEKIVSHVGDRTLYFVWHGGEPLLSGLDFFYGVAEITSRIKNVEVINAIQTNASLVNQEFIDFCKKTGFKVSTSLDGPAAINDLTRKDKNGNGTFQRTMDAINMLKKSGIDISCVSVLHQGNIHKIEDIYYFFRDHKINFRANPIVKAGNALSNYNLLAISPKEYGEAMCKLFDLWFEDDDPDIKVEPLMTIMGNILDDQVWGCNYQGKCLQSIISVTPEGNIYPCGRFIGDNEFELGNIVECSSLEEVFNSDIFKRLSSRDATTVPGCKICEFKEICNGGCMITAHMAKGNIFDSDYYCFGRKMLFKHMVERLQSESYLKLQDAN